MPNITSAKKRVQLSQAKAVINAAQKNKMRTAIRKLEDAIGANDKSKANEIFSNTMSVIAKTAKKGVIKKNTASRKISRLNAKIKALA